MRECKKNEELDQRETRQKKEFTAPKLKFVEPMFVKQGDATKVTAGFFGQFSP